MEFTTLQLEEIQKGVEGGLSEKMVGLYKDARFNYLKMHFIREAFEEGMGFEDVLTFANPSYSLSEMEMLKHQIQHGRDVMDVKEKKRRISTDLLCVCLFVLVFGLFVFCMWYYKCNKHVEVKICNPYSVAVGDMFQASDAIESLQLNANMELVKPEDFEASEVGSYMVVYEVKDLFGAHTIPIRVDVLDETAPEIVFKKDEALLVKGASFDMFTYLDCVMDDVDGCITSRCTCVVEEVDETSGVAIYEVSDEAGNVTKKELPIQYLDVDQYVEELETFLEA